ncbi:MAG: hypothetical protein H5T62_03010 [Anaerolineae bacterium]|nr:hypothetical protein [Anaerolineae bacterium]
MSSYGRLEEWKLASFHLSNLLKRNMLQAQDEVKLLDLYNHTWNTLGALIRSLQQKKLDGTWDRSYTALHEEQEAYEI